MKKESLRNVITSNFHSPVMKIKFSNISKPFFYPSTPEIPSFSVTCVIDPVKDREFMKMIQEIEQKENMVSIIKDETVKDKETGEVSTTGRFLIKFNSKNKVPVCYIKNDNALPPQEATTEPKYGTECSVIFDMIRYVKKGTQQKGLSLQHSTIYIHETPPAAQPSFGFSNAPKTASDTNEGTPF